MPALPADIGRTAVVVLCIVMTCAPHLTAHAEAPPDPSLDDYLAAAQACLDRIGYPVDPAIPLAINDDRSNRHTIMVQVGETFAEGWWGPSGAVPLLALNRHDASVRLRFYRLNADGSELPRPTDIFAGLVVWPHVGPHGQPRAVTAIELMRRWFEVHREQQGRGVEGNLRAYVRAHRAAGTNTLLFAALDHELAETSHPRTRYAIMDQQAMLARDAGNHAVAKAIWLEAVAEMAVAGDHAWYVTRTALPQLAIAKMYRDTDLSQSLDAYRAYFATGTNAMGVSQSLAFCEALLEAHLLDEAIAHLAVRIEYLETAQWASDTYRLSYLEDLTAAHLSLRDTGRLPAAE